MGGVSKGLLLTPDGSETLIARLLRVCTRAAPNARLYLVGEAAPYATLALPSLPDDPAGVGPIGGLRSLLLCASELGSPTALALACDLPYLDEAVIARLTAPLSSAARVPLVADRLQPLAAAYDPVASLSALDRSLSVRKYALMHVLDELGASVERVELHGTEADALRDWDTPEDVRRY